jgi:FAD linked oxidases, C-terminal domain
VQDGTRRHRVEAQGLALSLGALARLAQNEELGCTGREAGSGGGLGKRAVTELERKHLVETERHIAECKAHIAKQRDLIERAIEQGRPTEVAETTLETLETSLRTFDRQRPPLFAEALRAAKKALDPQGLLNPGVLLDP